MEKFSDESLHPDIRSAIVKVLGLSEETGVLLLIARGCFGKEKQVAEACRGEIQKFSPEKLNVILDLVIDGQLGVRGKQFVELAHELRGQDTVRHI